jgi:hypothetical protein
LAVGAGHPFTVGDKINLVAPASERWRKLVGHESHWAIQAQCLYEVVAVDQSSVTIHQVLRTPFLVEDGSYVIGTGNAIDDPEDATDVLTYTYSRLSDNQAVLLVNGSYYEPELGLRPKQSEQFLFTFTSANAAGSCTAKVKYTGVLTVTAGGKSKKFTFKGAGDFSFVPPGVAP